MCPLFLQFKGQLGFVSCELMNKYVVVVDSEGKTIKTGFPKNISLTVENILSNVW